MQPLLLADDATTEAAAVDSDINNNAAHEESSVLLLAARNLRRTDYLTQNQSIALITIGCFSSLLSMLGSGSIVWLIYKDKKWTRQQPAATSNNRSGGVNGGMYYRLMLGLSASDLLVSLGTFLGPFLMVPDQHLTAARGNTKSCTAGGLFIFVTMSSVCYNFFLAIFYYRTIVVGEKEERLSQRYEPWMHGYAIGLQVIFNAIALSLKGYNPAQSSGFCSLEFYPVECLDNDLVECERGLYTVQLGLTALFAIGIPAIGGCVLTVLVYLHVMKILERSRSYRMSSEAQEHRRKRQVAVQAVWYCIAYMNAILWAVTFTILEYTTTQTRGLLGKPGVYFYLVLQTLFFPVQGFINFLNYVRPRYQDNRTRHACSRFRALKLVFCDDNAAATATTATSNININDGELGTEQVRNHGRAILAGGDG